MKHQRRDFLRISGLACAGLVAGYASPAIARNSAAAPANARPARQHFNMSGYAAPRLEQVRIGFIGLGNRGPAAVVRMSKIEGVAITALCDLLPEKARAAKEKIKDSRQDPVLYSGNKDAWQKLCERPDIDLIYIATPWSLHTPMAVYAMKQGKHVAVEVPAAVTLEECWQLVETSEQTRKHCMMLENCCYDFFELLTLNMARQNFFGDIIHGEGAYIHDIMESNFTRNSKWDNWRLKENASRNGNLYPTHGLGPVCQAMNINRGDKLEYLVSVSGNDFMMQKKAQELARKDAYYQEFATKAFRGNMNTTTMRTHKGRTIMLQHDVTSPRPYSRIHLLSGTKGVAQKYPEPGRIATSHQGWLSEPEMKALQAQYQPAIVTKIGEMAKQVGGHGGMDFLMDWRLVDCLRNGIPLDQDVYDAALWSAIGPLSEQSVKNRSNSVDIPDFTSGSWKTNQPVDLAMTKGGNTRVVRL